ncbi:MAG: Hsp33 family molecular chaperone HslO [Lachnospiraceae bacterium]|nr:Hsp33 family molecular chaperone HslO [Lachnospiraceae bacterium]
MSDYMIRATAAGGQVRAFAATTRDLVEYARQAHNTSPVVSAALGRTLTGGVMMGAMMKSEKDLLTIKIEGDGPIGSMLVTADALGHVKGYAQNPQVILPANDKGKLDVANAVGIGVLSVIKDIGLKEPYVGQTILITSEIAEDLTYYFATSEQTPSSVGLGVLMNRENTVRQAGGFILQMMPDATEETISALEKRLGEVSSVTSMLDAGMTPEAILDQLLGDMDLAILDRIPVSFHCDCSKERFARGIASIQKADIQEMIDEGKEIEVCCQFCNKAYAFSPEELKELL